MSDKQNMSYDMTSIEKVFELPEIGWNLSMMRMNYKLTKRAKTEKIKNLRENNTVKFNTIHYELRALSNIIN